MPTLICSAMHEGYVKPEKPGARIMILPSSLCSLGVDRTVNIEVRPTPLRVCNELANFAPVPASGCPLQNLVTSPKPNAGVMRFA